MKKVRNFFLYAVVAVAIAAVSAHLIWKYSGSGQWELVKEKKGIRVYAMKTPGVAMMQFKGVARVQSSMHKAVALLLDPGICDFGDLSCYDSIAIQKVDEQRGGAGYYSFKWRYPFYFRPRQYVVEANFTQNPVTKEIYETVKAAPDKLPPDDCCLRVTQMQNSWRLKPLNNGEIEIEYVVNTAGGGFFPYILDNVGGDDYVYYVLSKFPKWVENERYRNAKVAFVANREEELVAQK
ncbi:MAG TPA: hypothetical protein VEO54_11840 [Thermoanaerobaculia bacterium]|nr:hypothetical protein [Thermoanaerobaculia bacterium]